MTTGVTKNGTLATTFHYPLVGSNMYVRFVYGPKTIFNHARGQFSGSVNADPVNSIYTSQKSTKIGFCEELEGDFISSKAIN